MGKPAEDEVTNENKTDKAPSRWWVLYHFWGGICLNMYINVSGLSKFLLGTLGDTNSASSYAGTAAMLAVGAVALGYYLSKALIKKIDGGNMKNKNNKSYCLFCSCNFTFNRNNTTTCII